MGGSGGRIEPAERAPPGQSVLQCVANGLVGGLVVRDLGLDHGGGLATAGQQERLDDGVEVVLVEPGRGGHEDEDKQQHEAHRGGIAPLWGLQPPRPH